MRSRPARIHRKPPRRSCNRFARETRRRKASAREEERRETSGSIGYRTTWTFRAKVFGESGLCAGARRRFRICALWSPDVFSDVHFKFESVSEDLEAVILREGSNNRARGALTA